MNPADELAYEQNYRECDPLNLDADAMRAPPQAQVLVYLKGYASDPQLRFTVDAEYGEDRAVVTLRAEAEMRRRLDASKSEYAYSARVGAVTLPQRPSGLTPEQVAGYVEAFKGDNS
jgi:hypothetical protein